MPVDRSDTTSTRKVKTRRKHLVNGKTVDQPVTPPKLRTDQKLRGRPRG